MAVGRLRLSPDSARAGLWWGWREGKGKAEERARRCVLGLLAFSGAWELLEELGWGVSGDCPSHTLLGASPKCISLVTERTTLPILAMEIPRIRKKKKESERERKPEKLVVYS